MKLSFYPSTKVQTLPFYTKFLFPHWDVPHDSPYPRVMRPFRLPQNPAAFPLTPEPLPPPPSPQHSLDEGLIPLVEDGRLLCTHGVPGGVQHLQRGQGEVRGLSLEELQQTRVGDSAGVRVLSGPRAQQTDKQLTSVHLGQTQLHLSVDGPVTSVEGREGCRRVSRYAGGTQLTSTVSRRDKRRERMGCMDREARHTIPNNIVHPLSWQTSTKHYHKYM